MDIISIIIGFIFGVIVVAIAVEVGLKRSSDTEPGSKHTKNWNISEINNPRIMAEYLSDVELPKNSKVVVNKYKDKNVLTGLNVRENRDIKGNFILGDDRALILAGPIRKDEIGFWTVEKDILEELNQQFENSWLDGEKIEEEKK